MKPIGGEYAIALDNLKNDISQNIAERIHFSSGRAALFHILKLLKKEGYAHIYIPTYICESIPRACIAAGFRIRWYSLEEHLKPESKLYTQISKAEKSAVLVVNYFGLTDTSEMIEKLKDVNSIVKIIQDNVQAFYSMQIPSKADFVFTSYRKTFSVPDGAWVINNSNYTFAKQSISAHGVEPWVQYKLLGGCLKHAYLQGASIDDAEYVRMFETGERLIDAAEIGQAALMSRMSLQIISGLPLKKIAVKRRRNFKFLSMLLRCLGIRPLLQMKKRDVPLFLPIQIKHRDAVRAYLRTAGIYAPVHWPHTNSILAQEELSLPIDQRYSWLDMLRIAWVLFSYKKDSYTR